MSPTNLLLLVAVVVVLTAGAVLAMLRMRRTVPNGHALIINGTNGEPRVTFGTAMVLPIVQRAETIDISVKTLTISRRGKEGVICGDNLRADLDATFFVRINKTRDDVLRVAQSIGCVRASQPHVLEELFVAKFSEAIKIVAKHLDFEELYTKRDIFKDQVIQVIGRDLSGYCLDDLAIDYLEQTPIELLDPNNVLDAQGIRKIKALAESGRLPPRTEPSNEPASLQARLEKLGLLDVTVTTEVECSVSPLRPSLELPIEADKEPAAGLPSTITKSILTAAGTGALTCKDGRAVFRWTATHVTEAQLIAGARIVHALRDDDHAYR